MENIKYETGVKFFDEKFGGLDSDGLVLLSGARDSFKTRFPKLVLERLNKVSKIDTGLMSFTQDEDIEDVEKLVGVWAKQGCKVFVLDDLERITNKKFDGKKTAKTENILARIELLTKALNIAIMLIVKHKKTENDTHSIKGCSYLGKQNLLKLIQVWVHFEEDGAIFLDENNNKIMNYDKNNFKDDGVKK